MSVTKSKTKAKPAKARTSARRKLNGTNSGYKGHRAGSAREKAHKLFDIYGPDKARAKVEKLGLAEATINTCFSVFRNKY